MKITDSDMQQRFVNDGFYVFRNLLEPELIDKLRRITDEVLDQQEETHFEQQRAPGSMVMIDWDMAYRYDVFAELIVHPKMLKRLAELGFAQPKFGHGRIISKPPHSPRLFWHEDGRFWDDPVSYTPQPIQCFLMYYLVDTTPENGCLRVIPGSHLKRHALHDQVPERHTEKLSTYADPDHTAFQHAEGEIDVPLEGGGCRDGLRHAVSLRPCQPDGSAPDGAYDVVLSRFRRPARIHPSHGGVFGNQDPIHGAFTGTDAAPDGAAQDGVRGRCGTHPAAVDAGGGFEVVVACATRRSVIGRIACQGKSESRFGEDFYGNSRVLYSVG